MHKLFTRQHPLQRFNVYKGVVNLNFFENILNNDFGKNEFKHIKIFKIEFYPLSLDIEEISSWYEVKTVG